MKRLCLGSVLVCILGVAHGSEIDVNLYDRSETNRTKAIARRTAEPEEVRFQRDSDRWKSFCRYYHDDSFNTYDLTATISKLRSEVVGDPVAAGAMDVFLSCFYWKFTDYCVQHLTSMSGINHQRFREVLIILAPGLGSTRYMARAVRLVCRDQREIRAADLQHLPFCLDMFFYAAVRNGQLGRYALANMCTNAFLAPCLKWDSNGCADERFNEYDLGAVFDRCFDDWPEIGYFIESIWPNWK